MRIVNHTWKRNIICCKCGSTIEIKNKDVSKFIYEDRVDGRQISIYYYTVCPIDKCRENNTVENLPSNVRELAKNKFPSPKNLVRRM